MKVKLFTAVMGTALLALAGCQSVQDKVPADSLVAVYTGTAPNLAAGAADPVWAKASPLSAELTGGVNFGAKPGAKGESSVTLKAAYTNDMLYMLVQYKDPTNSIRRGPFQKQADGSWKKLKDPADKGGDDNMYYEDKWAMLWPTNEATAKPFDNEGCAMACHEGQTKPYGNKYTNLPGQLLDMWHMKGQRTGPLGYLDDQYTDDTRYDAKTAPNAGRKGDPGPQGGEYTNIALVDGKPAFMGRDAKAANAGGTYYIKKGDQVPFDDSKFKAGDEVASIIINPLTGTDRGDVQVANTYANGMHTSVVSRKLVTGSKFDVQFANLSARYGFGFAAFDNAQVRHATSDDPMYLVFGKK
ncbi:ethylbenzene dehydrogenase-related protein [Rhodoferax sp.]|uniref:ethylbenzene dehydrogenase-related protein n=1 Tax=Rhodoferax sp. TaxID=50421 RepID=UPI0027309286|nr:ethylbenzene dehydrogenase-related protein [Rhodoferax sp.]MDP1531591.1 ethylbenzene dehydrogenase-related protein [Rhodoferax sp.]MDP1944148.1 ethylbenzene dehydrogenase-related protein [Rhodoferax sp.]MDP2441198.1 ethylbenzene dehydrogenase-related protein [Rhodoferax sp.]MDZ4209525.1 ethylbenzene dehydrogenase-related protein [Rhodoferax sp.]